MKKYLPDVEFDEDISIRISVDTCDGGTRAYIYYKGVILFCCPRTYINLRNVEKFDSYDLFFSLCNGETRRRITQKNYDRILSLQPNSVDPLYKIISYFVVKHDLGIITRYAPLSISRKIEFYI